MTSLAFRRDGRFPLRHVVVAGWFGSGNFGDELLLHTLMTNVAAANPRVEFTVLSAGPERVRHLHGCSVHRLPVIRGGGLRASLEVRRILSHASLLVMGPGTIFQESSDVLRWPGTLPMMTRVAALARSAGTPVAICGAAVREGGTPFGAALLRITGALARDVAVRDRASAKRLSRRARVIGDVAFAHRGVGATDRHTVDASFLVSMRPLANAAEQRLASTLREVAYRLSQRGLAGAFLPMSRGYGASGEDDVEIYDRYLADVMPTSATHLEERPFAELAKAWFELLARQQLILATRLHAAVPSVMCGVPTVAFAYEHKVSETFKQLGLSEYVMDVGASADDVMRVAEAAISESGLRDFANAREIAASQGALVRQTIASLTGRWR